MVRKASGKGGFPGGASGKEPACQCGRCKSHGFCPWVGRSSRKKLTEDGENDHEEEEKQEDVHEGRQGLKHLTQVAGGETGPGG